MTAPRGWEIFERAGLDVEQWAERKRQPTRRDLQEAKPSHPVVDRVLEASSGPSSDWEDDLTDEVAPDPFGPN